MLSALQEIHKAGWIHRDVKPANFAMLRGAQSEGGKGWRIIDFGIARRFMAEDGHIIPQREDFGEFRGSTTYASINAHLKQDLGEPRVLQQPHMS
jgi:tau tubulin kinase